MTLKHVEAPLRPFRPTGKGGGSKPGKPTNRWPLVIRVVADAVAVRALGTMDAWVVNRRFPMELGQFGREMEATLPGLWEWVGLNFKATKTAPVRLLVNRVYKMYYSGTSDRGSRHDPKTRACQSGEHWLKKVPEGHELRRIHDKTVRGLYRVIPDWKDYI